MEMEMEVKDELNVQLDRLAAAAAMLEEAAARVGAVQVSAAAELTHELQDKLREAEATIASLRASGRRAGALVGKDAPDTAGGVDAALISLPVEQRIAVKAQLIRSGLL